MCFQGLTLTLWTTLHAALELCSGQSVVLPCDRPRPWTLPRSIPEQAPTTNHPRQHTRRQFIETLQVDSLILLEKSQSITMAVTEVGCMVVKPGVDIMDENSQGGQILNTAWKAVTSEPTGPYTVYWGLEVEDPSHMWGFFDFESVEKHQKFANEYGPPYLHPSYICWAISTCRIMKICALAP